MAHVLLLCCAQEVCRYKGCDVRNVESLVAVLGQIVEHRNLSRSLLMDTLMGVGVLIQGRTMLSSPTFTLPICF